MYTKCMNDASTERHFLEQTMASHEPVNRSCRGSSGVCGGNRCTGQGGRLMTKRERAGDARCCPRSLVWAECLGFSARCPSSRPRRTAAASSGSIAFFSAYERRHRCAIWAGSRCHSFRSYRDTPPHPRALGIRFHPASKRSDVGGDCRPSFPARPRK